METVKVETFLVYQPTIQPTVLPSSPLPCKEQMIEMEARGTLPEWLKPTISIYMPVMKDKKDQLPDDYSQMQGAFYYGLD